MTKQIFEQRHVVVSGATGELGSAVVQALLAQGAICHLPCRSRAKIPTFDPALASRVIAVEGVDPTHEASVQAFYDALPPLWASIHCVGAFLPGSLRQAKLEDLEQMLAINAKSAFLCSRAALTRMSAGGRIVQVVARSVLEARRGAGAIAYAMSKAALAALTVALAEECCGEGILVNAVAPGTLDTPANRAAQPTANFDHWPKVEEVAAHVVYLASPDNRSIQGALLPIFGGP